MDSGTEWLCEILRNVQLEQFYLPIRDQLQITRLAHFDYVHAEDLERIGISKPGIRRLFDAVRKKKLLLWNRKFWSKLFGTSSSSISREKTDLALKPAQQNEPQTTCIILEKDIVLHNELGNGSFGVVKKGEWKVSTQPPQTIPVAVKVLKADAFSQPGIYDDFRREVEAMHSLHHPNLIKLHGVVFHPLMMVCELAPMGALLDYIRSQNGKVSLNFISKWSSQVAAGMAHLEKNRFLHRDLACRNILLSTLELVKIGDFGLMRALPDADDCYVMSERRRVPFPWCAPESLRSRQFSHASDVWMFAVALWEMYTFGEEPWIGLNGSEILRLIVRDGQRLSAPNACPPDVYMLMMQCWDLVPKERPTFAGIQRYMETNKFETAIAALSYKRQGQMTIEAGDAIILIDKRPELHWWKGQNQRTLDVGLFPSTLVTTAKNKHVPSATAKKSQTLSPVRRVLVKEDILIDLDLPPSTRLSTPTKKPVMNNVSILDEPIDVPEIGQEPDWSEQSIESLPPYSANSSNTQNYTNLYGARSLDNLTIPNNAPSLTTQQDPFDTSQYWPTTSQGNSRPNYDFNFTQQNQVETNRYTASNAASTSTDISQIYNNMTVVSRNNTVVPNNTVYNTVPVTIYASTNTQSVERRNESNITSLANMSLDDRISESLNLRSKNTNNENIYSNSSAYGDPSTLAEAASNAINESRYNDIPIYNNFDMNPAQQQFLLETKDYYTKLSTASNVRTMNDYEKNIYVPKFEDEGEKLQNFSDSMQNSKNYSALKYQNVDYNNYSTYSNNYGTNVSAARAQVTYDEVNDTASNFYSEINEAGNQGRYGSTQATYANAGLYDEVYEEPAPRPHRPAPPCPSKPK
ncbi:activated Cdc42 kinase Ack isoform X2 [Galleria mellonella]|uniref:non-specific protein-tyrosine kinase n=1 Tax=Galleria mellonella TaxID=7137 RepID=A0A6J1WY10_GALME|nr:activated Cdc42 kinase Ack isoform X2 [Galleria mellonella]